MANAVCEEVVESTRREEAGDVEQDLRWTLAEYCGECTGMMDVGHLIGRSVDGDSLFMYGRKNFQHDSAFCASK